nr:cyclase family protein [Algoriphagus sp. A40]
MKSIHLLSLSFVTLFSCKEKPQNATLSADPLAVLSNLEWIDLTYAFDSTTLYWPNNLKGFELENEAEGITELGFYYSSNSLSTPEHGGTHLDAPIHFSASGKTLDHLDLTQLTGEAILIDVSEMALANRDYLIDSAAILAWEAQHGQIPNGTIVLFRTGSGLFIPIGKSILALPKPEPKLFPNSTSLGFTLMPPAF